RRGQHRSTTGCRWFAPFREHRWSWSHGNQLISHASQEQEAIVTISTPSPALAAAGLAAPSRKPLPILTERQRTGLRPELLEVIENRKSGLSLNHVVGCPLDCGYCVRHLFDNFAM